MNLSAAADSLLLQSIKQRLGLAINDMTMNVVHLVSCHGIDIQFKKDDYSFRRDYLEQTFTDFLDVPTVIADADKLYEKLHQFEKKTMIYYLAFWKARRFMEDPLEGFNDIDDLLDSESCFDMQKIDDVFYRFASDLVNEYSWQIRECLKEDCDQDCDKPQTKKTKT
jgi:hypothetical protein